VEFRPERWLNVGGSFEVENPFKFPVFNTGPQIFLGKEMAFIQMKFVVATSKFVAKELPVSHWKTSTTPLRNLH
jgi:hypothetical protein